MSRRPEARQSRIVVCRGCSRFGLETPDDLAPGVCPDCLDRAMAGLTRRIGDLTVGLDDDQRRTLIRRALCSIGLSPPAAEAFIRDARRGDARPIELASVDPP